MPIATAQFTIIDLADITVGSAPVTPALNQLWLDTSVTPSVLKTWNGSIWINTGTKVFVAQPTTPYSIGDLWSQGTAGDLMKCIVARTSGAYTASDWDYASKYTDDTTANQAIADAAAAKAQADAAAAAAAGLSTRIQVAELKITPQAITQTVEDTSTQ